MNRRDDIFLCEYFQNPPFVQAEVVEMNPAEAIAANLARLSYNASLRARAALRRAAARLSIGQVGWSLC